MSKVRVAGAIASQNGITFYLENGEELNLVKDSARTRMILDATVEALARREIVEIDLDSFSIEKRIEKKTGGLIRFMKTTASKLALLVGKELSHDPETEVIGVMDRTTPAPTKVSDEPEISVAIVKTPKGDVFISGVEKLERQMEYAAFEDVAGFQKFMERIAAVIGERQHSVNELLNFMKKGDLPIADDGSIVAYKMLYEQDNYFVDPHTKQVRQKVGSHVSMPVDRVDSSRRTQCSTGLHIARRGYIKSFHGDTIMLVKVAPEDVIAVPSGEPDKMRAAAYHVVAKLPLAGAELVRQNKPMTSDKESSQLLADVIAGNHPKILEYVRINGANGTNLEIVPADGVKNEPIVTTGKLVHALDAEESATTVSLKDIRDRADKAIVDQKAAQAAAASGNIAAAVSEPEKPKKAAAKVAKPEQKSEPVKSPMTKVADTLNKQLPEKHAAALRLHGEGLSNRQIEAELHICRKTLKKLFDKNGLQPNG